MQKACVGISGGWRIGRLNREIILSGIIEGNRHFWDVFHLDRMND